MASKNNDVPQCLNDGHSLVNPFDIQQRFCDECGASGKLVMRPARVIKHCSEHGEPLMEIRQVCSERNTLRNRLKRAIFIGYSHMDAPATTLHKSIVSKINFKRAK